MTVPGNKLRRGGVYVFTLTVHKAGRRAVSTRQTVSTEQTIYSEQPFEMETHNQPYPQTASVAYSPAVANYLVHTFAGVKRIHLSTQTLNGGIIPPVRWLIDGRRDES